MLGVSTFLLPLPLVPLASSLIVLIFSGKKYFLGFWGVIAVSYSLMFYQIESIEIPALVHLAFGSTASVNVLHGNASPEQLAHATATFPLLETIGIGAVSLMIALVLGSYFSYKFIRKVLIGRVRGWELRR